MAYYSDSGSGGTPLVLIHSINAAPSAFEVKPLFEHYRSQRPVYAPDLPGFGASERADRDYTPQFFADTLCHFIEQIAGAPADVVALSLSSEFAARAAALAPDLVRSLALISPTGFGKGPAMDEHNGERLVRLIRTPLIGTGLFRLLTVKPSIRYFLNLNFVGRAPEEMVDYAHLTSHRPGAIFAPCAFLSGKLFAADAPATLYAPLELPALVLYDRDPNLSFERLPQLVDSKANWHSQRISPSLGLPHFENLDAVVQALERFWSSAA